MVRLSFGKQHQRGGGGLAEESSSDEDSGGSFGRQSGMILLSVGWGTALLAAYVLGETGGTLSTNPMWKNDFFSEYLSPRRIHVSLFQSRGAFLAKGGSGSTVGMPKLWDPTGNNGWKACSESGKSNSGPQTGNGYLQVFCSGGLFQLHICVCNAVAAAKMLNATLLIPYFRRGDVWQDPSQFHDIYDVDHFMSYLKEDLSIVRSLPAEYDWSIPDMYDDKCETHTNCIAFPPKHATMSWYFTNVLPILQRHGVAAIERYNHKLSFDDLPADIVSVRCRTNFYALRFVDPIIKLSETLIHRLKLRAVALEKGPTSELMKASKRWWDLGLKGLWSRRIISKSTLSEGVRGEGRFVGIHMRFEKDMVAHSACYYDGGRAEKKALSAFRRVFFKNRVAKAQHSPNFLRANGSCPLTPEEVGLFLSGLGFRNNTVVYTAGKSIYGGNARLQPLKDLFPALENKESLATFQELEQFLPFSHKLAALDFLVLLGSDVFMSNSAGNFPNVLTGHRTFSGPKKSIHPNKALLAKLFTNTTLSWKEFSDQATAAHYSRLGAPEPRKRKYSVFRYPAPDCMCQR